MNKSIKVLLTISLSTLVLSACNGNSNKATDSSREAATMNAPKIEPAPPAATAPTTTPEAEGMPPASSETAVPPADKEN